eukprot:INCI16410.13.p1 GENE.INCI16410.13~~INCI16410.13.p1  ORF type:complete len:580 (+),score=65.71 INCI16410.13:934-2673(+)
MPYAIADGFEPNCILQVRLARGDIPPWLEIAPSSQRSLQRHWAAWLDHLRTLDGSQRLLSIRAATISIKGSGHGRVGVSASWQSHGVSSLPDSARRNLRYVNPTLFDFVQNPNAPKFMESQGCAGAFRGLRGQVGTATFAASLQQKWFPLLEKLATASSEGFLRCLFVHGDCMELLPQRALGEGFHAIDTSNVMDYCGAWNLVLACVPCLEATTKQTSPFRPFVFTEQILGVASTVDDMLREVLPYDEDASHRLAGLMGLRISPVPRALDHDASEKVVHARWCLCQPNASTASRQAVRKSEKAKLAVEALSLVPGNRKERVKAVISSLWASELQMLVVACREVEAEGASLGSSKLVAKQVAQGLADTVDHFLATISAPSNVHDISEDAAETQSLVFSVMQHMLVPVHMSAKMLGDVHKPIDLSYAWPTSTVATFAELVACMCTSPVASTPGLIDGLLDRFFADPKLCKHPHIRNRTLACVALLHIVCNEKPKVLADAAVGLSYMRAEGFELNFRSGGIELAQLYVFRRQRVAGCYIRTQNALSCTALSSMPLTIQSLVNLLIFFASRVAFLNRRWQLCC